MKNRIFRNTIFISLLGHITVFGIFSFSFGYRVPANNYAQIYSWGGILNSYDLIPFLPQASRNNKFYFRPSIKIAPPDTAKKEYTLVSQYYLKPQVFLSGGEEKLSFKQRLPAASSIAKQKEQVIMLHPQLPVNFLLFFKDRQAVHIELMFSLADSMGTSSTAIKRKISSGNLEADLLSMRYISHYLFLQQTRFGQDKWQSVKIDLSAKND